MSTLDPDELSRLQNQSRIFRLDLITHIDAEMLDSRLVETLPVEWARSRVMLPCRHQGHLGVLMATPESMSDIQHIALLLHDDPHPLLAPRALILENIEQCYVNKTDSARDFIQEIKGQPAGEVHEKPRTDDLLEAVESTPITQLINLILLEAIKAGASDIHVEPFETRLRIRYRIDGVLYEQAEPPKHLENALVSRLKVMAHMDIAEKRLPQDGVARVRIGEREIDIRVSTLPVAEGERVVLRLLSRESALLPLAGLGMNPAMLSSLEALMTLPHGVFIVCGPTGSGKTTTLYAVLQRLDKRRSNILTIEDPIEYQLPDIGQMQVKPKIGLSFAEGLRHILRQDPDTILVGEIRDLETAEIAIRASLTGHRVFSTLHTNDAPGTVIRLIDMGIEPFLVASSLRAVLAQRLIRRLCPLCRRPEPPDARLLAWFADAGHPLQTPTVWRAVGCDHCYEGYRGRLGIFEWMPVDVDMADTIRSRHADSRALRDLAAQHGMISLLEDTTHKLAQGLTSFEEIQRAMGTVL